MTLESIYFVSQVVAALAIVGSLVFVGIQIRQNTRVQRIQAQASRRAHIGEFRWRMTDPAFAQMMRKGGMLEPQSEVERLGYIMAVTQILQGIDETYVLHSHGLIGELQKRHSEDGLEVFMQAPGFRIAYQLSKGTSSPWFATDAFDAAKEKATGIDPIAIAPIWDALAAEERKAIAERKATENAPIDQSDAT